MFEIKIKSDFSSAHRLEDYNVQCENYHGHNWKVEVTVSRECLDNSGMVMDFKELQQVLDGFLANFDHRCLNDLDYFSDLNPTSENVAYIIYQNIAFAVEKDNRRIKKIEVFEEEHSSASYIPNI